MQQFYTPIYFLRLKWSDSNTKIMPWYKVSYEKFFKFLTKGNIYAIIQLYVDACAEHYFLIGSVTDWIATQAWQQ